MHIELDPIELGCGYPFALLREAASNEAKLVSERILVSKAASKKFTDHTGDCLTELFSADMLEPRRVAIELASAPVRAPVIARYRRLYIDMLVSKLGQ